MKAARSCPQTMPAVPLLKIQDSRSLCILKEIKDGINVRVWQHIYIDDLIGSGLQFAVLCCKRLKHHRDHWSVAV